IMAIGVATSNSILMITFANEQRSPRLGSHGARGAALVAGRTRLRPVLMTALAMLLGMLPIRLGRGEGGEQKGTRAGAVVGGGRARAKPPAPVAPGLRDPPPAGGRVRTVAGRHHAGHPGFDHLRQDQWVPPQALRGHR